MARTGLGLPWLGALLAVALAALLAACGVGEISLSGKECPCVADYVCDEATNRCVPIGAVPEAGLDATTDRRSPMDGARLDGTMPERDGGGMDAASSDTGAADTALPDVPCDDTQTTCMSDVDCCPGHRCNATGACVPSCTGDGGACSTMAGCCASLVCYENTCRHCQLSGTCTFDTDCCSGQCICGTVGPRCM